MTLRGPLAYSFGEQDSRFEINTPALVLDLDALERNIARMTKTMRTFGRNLRPHAKSHKCSRIGKMQIDAGAIGICCATLDEAEVMAAAGLTGIVITSPITARPKLARLMEVVAEAPATLIVVDNTENVDALSDAAASANLKLSVLIDLDLGFGRTGVSTIEALHSVAGRVLTAKTLRFGGLQAYSGHLQHLPEYELRLRETHAANDFVHLAKKYFQTNNIAVPLITGGGTGTHAIDGRAGPFTEIQAGPYVFMDAEYKAIAYEGNEAWPFEVSLFVQTAVVSNNTPAWVTVDAGTKALAVNGPKPLITADSLLGSVYDFAGDEHGRVTLASESRPPKIGERLELVVSHCDPTIALYDSYHCVRGSLLVDLWPIDARGRR
jgi:D-serine deaminase-like pyridoxal phosphate-dependent protein